MSQQLCLKDTLEIPAPVQDSRDLYLIGRDREYDRRPSFKSHDSEPGSHFAPLSAPLRKIAQPPTERFDSRQEAQRIRGAVLFNVIVNGFEVRDRPGPKYDGPGQP